MNVFYIYKDQLTGKHILHWKKKIVKTHKNIKLFLVAHRRTYTFDFEVCNTRY